MYFWHSLHLYWNILNAIHTEDCSLSLTNPTSPKSMWCHSVVNLFTFLYHFQKQMLQSLYTLIWPKPWRLKGHCNSGRFLHWWTNIWKYFHIVRSVGIFALCKKWHQILDSNQMDAHKFGNLHECVACWNMWNLIDLTCPLCGFYINQAGLNYLGFRV